MEPALKEVGDLLDGVELVIRRRPSGLADIHAPGTAAWATAKRCAFFHVVTESTILEGVRCGAACPQDAPPSHLGAVAGHDRADLPGAAGSQEFCHIAVGNDASVGDELDDGQNRFDELLPHPSTLVGGGRTTALPRRPLTGPDLSRRASTRNVGGAA